MKYLFKSTHNSGKPWVVPDDMIDVGTTHGRVEPYIDDYAISRQFATMGKWAFGCSLSGMLLIIIGQIYISLILGVIGLVMGIVSYKKTRAGRALAAITIGAIVTFITVFVGFIAVYYAAIIANAGV